MNDFPAFKAGGDSWVVASDGSGLMVKGLIRRVGSQRQVSINSLIPILSLTSAEASRGDGDALLNIRVWDGEEYTIAVAGPSRAVIAGIQGLVSLVHRNNAAWPMSSARAVSARRQIPVGYLRDRFLLGVQGIEEFWSPLADLHWEWSNLWRQSSLGALWPIASTIASRADASVLVCLLTDSIVLLDADSNETLLAFSDLKCPQLIIAEAPEATFENLHKVASCGLRISTSASGIIDLWNLPTHQLQPLFRFLLMRWAEVEAARSEDPATAISEAAVLLQRGGLTAESYAALLDAIIARASSVEQFQGYPPRERSYLRPVVAATPPAKPKPPSVAAPAVAPSRPGVNTRQVAAGAVAGAALWSLFSG